jgi:hypothetical protein
LRHAPEDPGVSEIVVRMEELALVFVRFQEVFIRYIHTGRLKNTLNFRRREAQGSVSNELDTCLSPSRLFVSPGGCTYSKITGAGPGILAHVKCQQIVEVT